MTNVVPMTRRLTRYPWAVVFVEADGTRVGQWRYSRRSLPHALAHWQQIEDRQTDSVELWYDPHKTFLCFNDLIFGV